MIPRWAAVTNEAQAHPTPKLFLQRPKYHVTWLKTSVVILSSRFLVRLVLTSQCQYGCCGLKVCLPELYVSLRSQYLGSDGTCLENFLSSGGICNIYIPPLWDPSDKANFDSTDDLPEEPMDLLGFFTEHE